MHPLVIYYLHIVDFIQQDISLIIIERKLYEKVLSGFKRTCNKNNQL